MVKIKKNKNLKTVGFDEEIITKDSANELLSKVEEYSTIKNGDRFNVEVENTDIASKNELQNKGSNESVVIKSRKDKRKKQDKQKVATENEHKNQESFLETKSKRKKKKLVTNEEQNLNGKVDVEDLNADKEEFKEKQSKRKKQKTVEVETSEPQEVTDEQFKEKQSKRKKKKRVDEVEISEQQELNDEQGDGVSIENPKVKTNESIRAQKKRKHAKLLEEKRLKAELGSQQNVLNYLSKWKHCRNEWKFEKLKQIWLQQNLFDTSKIPDEFWETAVEYFNGSKGFIRKVVLRDALKIIEKEESSQEENTDENYLLILKRARDIVQHLQE